MIQSATFSMDESQNILKTFLIDYDISKVIQKFVKRQPIHLRQHIKRIIRETIINIQAHLFKAGKIPSLLLYDNQSDQMFEAFMNIKDILPENEKDNFYLNFVNMKSEGCRIMRFGRTDYHVSINSEQRERIYARFISYTQHNSLYKYAITRKDQDCNVQTPPYSDPCKLFSARDLEFVFKTYCMCKGDIPKMALFFRQKGIEDSRFELQSLELSIPNLMLIGYYVAHKKSAESGQTQLIRWAQFRDKYPLPEQSDFKAKVIWIRIAIREDPQQNELRWIQKIQRRKVITSQIRRVQPPKKGPNLDHKKWRKGKQCVISVIKQEMQKSILKRTQEDYMSIDGQSVKSMKSGAPSKKQMKVEKEVSKKSSAKPKHEIEDSESDSYEEQKLSKRQMNPEFIKKIQKQSEAQSINEEMDEKDVVWQQIPDKSESNHPSQSNYSSAKFYSQKPIFDKPSQQPSLRSERPNPTPKKVKPKQAQPKKPKKQEKVSQSSEQEKVEAENFDEYDRDQEDELEGEMEDEGSLVSAASI